MDDFNDLFAFKPEGNFILTFKNEDRPGAISEVIAITVVCLNHMMPFSCLFFVRIFRVDR